MKLSAFSELRSPAKFLFQVASYEAQARELFKCFRSDNNDIDFAINHDC